ncbi:bifunctional riboflavin kinase/FAD synthetase [Lagierella sp.]|uniref:bifunctional riboflavin kinase/FAD synthetase n=1 Tax=Lagierella sp. TaxID=2849657 RepID=UPI0026123155|nr:bifunctional riboflavin kinase/FAD synthetase [Lagierella sp.]
MILEISKNNFKLNSNFVIALGNFDGFHIGHQSLIDELVEVSKETNLTPSVLLFKEHTKKVLEGKTFKYLTNLDDKIEILKGLKITDVFITDFQDIRNMTPIEFLDFLTKGLNVRAIVVGNDYKFGQFAKGNIKLLSEYCNENGLYLKILNQVETLDSPVKSTNIRKLIQSGKVREAKELLGRPYRVTGTVNHGYKRGRTLGFPTANITDLFDYILPKEGVYLTKTYIDGFVEFYYSLSFVGKNITFSEDELKIETYILDFDGDLYGKKLKIEFLDFIRDNIKFKNAEDLTIQIHKDIETARNILGF